ncbi:ATP-dependent nuclease subunit A [Candidatus Rhodobacter oscarellae]|uniref:DNA 3'-5' helicase n=1 Tax=Candidatus Rhodobacter oscarellae TaxID=1675527 RepID=A0A0J9GZL5_9RHOB|nr:double-strand break repair helicase AddA [Candidatus Rhodobacter lobularis]KMW58918.1 ATP-dependent nuclease subunit A [Candidatus Rhodobacter lobularis]
MDAATLRQVQAAEPATSTWLSANAGSGKTRVLTDRVARLLLEGVQPQNILCLTYTKAAASEMQNRLFKRLGDWSMRDDDSLAAELQTLGVAADGRLSDARRLFARAIETPGGLRIQTIHSFCAGLLRRFPLEAEISPNFMEIDERTARLLQDKVAEDLAERSGQAFDDLARHLGGGELGGILQAILNDREMFHTPAELGDLLQAVGLPRDFSDAALLRECFTGQEPLFMPKVMRALSEGSSTDIKAGQKLAGIDWAQPGIDDIKMLAGVFLYGESAKSPFGAKLDRFPTKACREGLGAALEPLQQFMQRIEAARDRRNCLYSAQKSACLHRFAAQFLGLYSAEKQRMGWLDFDDLILKCRALLSNDAVASWVLYRLDGGLDHILVDEAQDTSPAQWQVIERLAQEFTAGLGARDDVLRTIFVVGDKKQSIYSFQGADPREFDRMQAQFGEKLAQIEAPFQPLELEHSFRSSDAILRFVDRAVTIDGMRHRAFHQSHAGRVDLWPVVPKTEEPEKKEWYDPVDIVAENHHDVILAQRVAEFMAQQIGKQTLPTREGGQRLIRASDFLILVRRRSNLFEEVIRACKRYDLPVAGADRLKLGAEMAVKDLSALMAFLATPEDDLSLAAALKSPLFGWDEATLYELAANRGQTYLWQELRSRREDFADTVAMLDDLRGAADFLRPYDLIERILTRHEGRRKLLGRLGQEAEDGIDALLSQSLFYEQAEVPSLTGFISWMQTDEVEVKRQLDTAGDQIRVMTVHGAKGLESPIVILPDTNKRDLQARDQIVPVEGHAFWKVPAPERPDGMNSALTRRKARELEEQERLFYVAATRAETWLVIAAAGEVGEAAESWYAKSKECLSDLGAVDTEHGLRYEPLGWAQGELEQPKQPADLDTTIPIWASQVADTPARPEEPLAPSGLGGAKAIGGLGGQDEETALRHGSMVHRLLEVLPECEPGHSEAVAQQLLSAEFADAPQTDAIREAMAVLQDPALSHLFVAGTQSEVDLTASIAALNGRRVAGVVDKLVVTGSKVLAVDYKTNAVVPGSPAEVPEGILRQMGAYLAALEQIFPDKPVELAILWTRNACLMPLSHDIVRNALSRATTS